MTYILVGKQNTFIQEILFETLSKLWGREIISKEITSSPDIHILDIEGKNSIGIEEVKKFQTQMRYKPFQETKQVGIIFNSEKLTPQAQNALLKTLEEASKYSVFILCVDNERNLLATVRSRGKIIYSKSTRQKKEISNDQDFLNLDIIEQFVVIEEYATDKNSSLDLIANLEDQLLEKLEFDIKNGNIESSKKEKTRLEVLQRSREKIVANCNRRLVLESMILQIKA